MIPMKTRMDNKMKHKIAALLALALMGIASCQKENPTSSYQPIDYSIQSIPAIDEVMPAELVAVMGPYLHFGDNPPRIDTCFFADSLRLARFIHNTDIDPASTYTMTDGQFFKNKFNYCFQDQHRGIVDTFRYERAYGDISYGLGYYLFDDATVVDSIFVMGSGNDFTAYFRQSVYRRMEPNESLSGYIPDYDIQRRESVIMTGTLTPQGVSDFHLASRVESYSYESPRIGELHFMPQIHDIFLYDYPGILPYSPSFQKQNQ